MADVESVEAFRARGGYVQECRYDDLPEFLASVGRGKSQYPRKRFHFNAAEKPLFKPGRRF